MLRLFRKYYPVRNIFFVIFEGIFIYISVLFSGWIIAGIELYDFDKWLFLKTFLVTFLCQASLYYNDLYDLKVTNSFLELGIRLFRALGFAAIFLAFIYFIFPEANIGRWVFIVSIAFAIPIIVSWRFFYKIILDRGIFDQKIILLGSDKLAKKIIDEVNERKDSGYTVSAVVPEYGIDADFKIDKKTVVMSGDQYEGLCEIAKGMGVKKIVVALKEKRGGVFPIRELLNCRVSGIDVLEGNSFYEMLTGKLIVQQVNPGWLIFSKGFRKSWFRRFSKRAADIVLSFVMMVVLLPLIVIVAVLIKIDSKGPVLFSQDRVGEGRKEYMVYKFRSMVQDAEEKTGPVWAQDKDDRITRVGKLIRKWRIDEVPQLWNVFRGEMSFVGPRPEREYFIKQLDEVIPYYGQRFTVKPGLTGWAQVCLSYGASVEDAMEKLNYDLFYIKNMSIFMDLMILLRTVKTVLTGEGAR